MWGADLTGKPPPASAVRPVWVDLDRLYPTPQALPDEVTRADGLMLTGRLPGRLRGWRRGRDGRWLGIVDFTLIDAEGQLRVRQEGVAVPADVLSPMLLDPPR